MDNLNDMDLFASTMPNYHDFLDPRWQLHDFLDYTESYDHIGVHPGHNIDEYLRSAGNTVFESIPILGVGPIVPYVLETGDLPEEMLPSMISSPPPGHSCVRLTC
jgi:hypothetical protein